MRYVAACIDKSERDAAYRVYVSDTLRMLAENTANAFGGSFPTASLSEFLGDSKPAQVDPAEGRKRLLDKFREEG